MFWHCWIRNAEHALLFDRKYRHDINPLKKQFRRVLCLKLHKSNFFAAATPRLKRRRPRWESLWRTNELQWCRNRGGQGGHWLPPPYLADQLTLFQPGRADYLHLLPLAPPIFLTFRHHWTVDICKHKSVRQDLDKIPMGRITAQFQVEFSHLPFANWVNFVKAMCDM